ncbi:MAG: M23 family metallopeptidase [Chitinispirillaceae bacterium]|nr:M23 family metallopeptidase [Chitinispirillaceae bacterium]
MKKKEWTFCIVTPESDTGVSQVNLPTFLLVCILIVFLIGIGGSLRLLWFVYSYSSAKWGAFEAKRENKSLLMKLQFLSRFIEKEREKVETIIAFEDKIRLQYGMEVISKDVRKAGVGGLPSDEDILLTNGFDPILMKADALRESLHVVLRKSELLDSTLSNVNSEVQKIHRAWSQKPTIWPCEGRITSGFGYRFHPFEGHMLFHEGLDIANKTWTPIYATGDGIVKEAGWKEYFGRMVIVKHPDIKGCTVSYFVPKSPSQSRLDFRPISMVFQKMKIFIGFT